MLSEIISCGQETTEGRKFAFTLCKTSEGREGKRSFLR